MELSSDEVRLIEERRAANAMAPTTTLKCWVAHVLEDLRAEVSGITATHALDVKRIVATMIDRRLGALDGK